MPWHSPEDAMPWVGLYVSGASLLCTLAMAVDAFQGFRQWRLWFPCKFFTINAVSATLIAISMKLPADLTTKMPGFDDVQAKNFSIFFLVTMLANFLPSLGFMDDKDLLTNIMALGILIITITVNIWIQWCTGVVFERGTIISSIFPVILPLSVALIVPTSRRILEQRYKKLHEFDLAYQRVNFSYKELTRDVKKYWMMAETGNPQFVIICSPVAYALGFMFSKTPIDSLFLLVNLLKNRSYFWYGNSDFKWSIHVILAVQLFGIVVGSIAPIFRCLITISYFNISKRWSLNYINVFRVEKYWTQQLQQWKSVYVCSHISSHYLKIVVHSFKNMILNFCIALQVIVVVTCKTISLAPRSFLVVFSCCCYLCMSLLKRFKREQNESNNIMRSEMHEYSSYVLHIEEESTLSNWLLRNTLNSITKLLHKSEKKEPSNLVKLLKKSTGFNGVLEFDNHQVPPLSSDENQNSWSLVTVTLTIIAIALPNVAKGQVKELLASMREGLQFVGCVEENLNANIDDLVKARKASRHLWNEVEVYCKWLQIDLQNNPCKGKTSKEALKWLGDEAVKVVIQFKRCKNGSHDHSLHKFIAASCMYRISQTILLHCDEQENWPKDEELFERISTLNADILCACFTNLPRVIKLMCHHNAIEEREDSIRAAAQLLGKSKTILKILEAHLLPTMDIDSMAYLDKWRALPKSQIPYGSASVPGIQQGSSSSKESVIVTIV